MLHDWWMYRPDPEPVRSALPGIRGVLGWFAHYEQPDGLLHKVPWWSFIDWVQEKEETPTYDAHGESCMTTLEYLGAVDDAAALEKNFGDPNAADRDHTRATHVRSGIYDQCWSADRGLLADNPDRKIFSQQANILGVLYASSPKNASRRCFARSSPSSPGMRSSTLAIALIRRALSRSVVTAFGSAVTTRTRFWRSCLFHQSTKSCGSLSAGRSKMMRVGRSSSSWISSSGGRTAIRSE